MVQEADRSLSNSGEDPNPNTSSVNFMSNGIDSTFSVFLSCRVSLTTTRGFQRDSNFEPNLLHSRSLQCDMQIFNAQPHPLHQHQAMTTGNSQVCLCVNDSSSELSLSQLTALSFGFLHNKLSLHPCLSRSFLKLMSPPSFFLSGYLMSGAQFGHGSACVVAMRVELY